MAIVRSLGALQSTRTRGASLSPAPTSSALPAWGYYADYAAIYATQPNVRICVDFLARNIAQVPYLLYRRVSDTDRVRLAHHELALWLNKPNPYTTRYRLFESLIADLALYFNAYWVKVRTPRAQQRLGLVRLPPHTMTVNGAYLPSSVTWVDDGEEVELAMSEVVYFNGYNPLNALMGLSPIETLRRILAEDLASSDHREQYWRNASRVEGVIERPATAPKWTPDQKQAWRDQWRQRYSGSRGSGQVPVLEDGMTFKSVSYSARDSEYVAARQLTREECTRAFHIPLPMVGLLEHATFSNIKEQHKQLYADTLGPWFQMVDEAIELYLLPECRDAEDVYGEFNVAEKLRGNFEEQTSSLRIAVGRPFMTANEARARLNLSRISDDPSADQLAAQQGGPAASGAQPGTGSTSAPDETAGVPADAQTATVVRQAWARQAAQLASVPVDERARVFDQVRATHELATDLTPALGSWAEASQLAARITDATYLHLLEGGDAFAIDRPIDA